MKEKDAKRCYKTRLAGRSPKGTGVASKKMFFTTLLCGIASCALTACDIASCAVTVRDFSYAGTADTSSTVFGRENPFRELTCVQNGITKKIVYDYTDPETGVHYLIYSEDQYNAGMGGITPRLNPDGSTMVEQTEKGE